MNRIADRRAQLGYTQKHLATVMGIKHASMVSSWENERVYPDDESLVKLCEALECDELTIYPNGRGKHVKVRRPKILLVASSLDKWEVIDDASKRLLSWNYDVETCIMDHAEKSSWNEALRDAIRRLCNCTGLAWTRQQEFVPFEALCGVAKLFEMPCAPVDSWEPREA